MSRRIPGLRLIEKMPAWIVLFGGVLISVFVAELFIMVGLPYVHSTNPWFGAIIDAALLCVVVAPVLYILGMRVVKKQMRSLRKSREKMRESSRRLEELNKVFIKLGTNYDENVKMLTNAAGTMFKADSAIFNVRQGSKLFSQATYNVPADYKVLDAGQGHICFDLINKGPLAGVFTVKNLQATTYAQTDPCVKKYGLKTYVGYPVVQGGKCIGSLCTIFTSDREFTVEENKIITIIAAAIGIEQDRKKSLEKIESLARFPDENPNPIMRFYEKDHEMYANRSSEILLKSWGKTLENPGLPDDLEHTVRNLIQSGDTKVLEVVAYGRLYQVYIIPVLSSGYANLYARDISVERKALDVLTLRETGFWELNEVISSRLSYERKVERLLRIGCKRLGMAVGILSAINGKRYKVLGVHVPDGSITPEMEFDLSDTYCERTIQHNRPIGFVNASEHEEWRRHPCFQAFKLECYIGTVYTINGQMAGTLNFSNPEKRKEDFTEADYTFVRIMSQWISTQATAHKDQSEIRKLSSVATRTDNSVIITDAHGQIEWINAAFEKLTGYTIDEVVGKRPGSIVQGPETDLEVVRYMSNQLKAERGYDVELINYSKAGRKYWVDIEVRPLFDDVGKLKNFIAIESDITERKAAEHKLAQARQREVDIASRIQRTLLLGKAREYITGVECATLSVPSKEVDGDFYDCFVHSDDCMDVLVGDVMGKGVPAALLGAATKSAVVRALSSIITSSPAKTLPQPHEIIMSLHASMVKDLIDLESFVTLCYTRFYGKKRQLDFVDCGHTRTIHYDSVKHCCHLLSGTNMPLGFSPREAYEQFSVSLNPGDIIVFYSDGITEAENGLREMFGEERLQAVVAQNFEQNAAQLLETIHKSVTSFSGNKRFKDDLTCLVFKVDNNWENPVSNQVKYSFKADTAQLAKVRKVMSDFLNKTLGKQLIEHDLNLVLLALNEALTNIIQHASATQISLYALIRGDQLELEFIHDGVAFAGDGAVQSIPDGSLESGYGLFVMEQSMDAVHYSQTAEGRNSVKLIKKLNIQEEPPQ